MRISRRSFLVTTAGALVATACGDSGGSSDGTSASSAPGTDSAVGIDGVNAVVQRFPKDALTPGEVRLPISLASSAEVLKDGPAELRGTIRLVDGADVATGLRATKRIVDDGLPVYWAFTATIDQPGVYELVVDGVDAAPAAFQLFDPAEVAIPSPGEPLPPFDTPTLDDHRGVEPICSRLEGVCPLHDVTLTQALQSGKPVLYMIGTPAHCATGVCAPGLEYVIAAHERIGDQVVMVHADVYADDAATTTSPAVQAYQMSYEPVIFLADATGTVTQRIDVVWDQEEIDQALDALVGAVS